MSKEESMNVQMESDVQNESVSIDVCNGSESSRRTSLANLLKKKPPSIGSQLSFRLKQVSNEFKRLASSKRLDKVDSTNSGATRALKGLQFISRNVRRNDEWIEIEHRFDELAFHGTLPRSRFGQCIGMTGSDEFAGELFDALARQKGIMSAKVTKDEFRDFWEHLTDQSFDTRLQIFFDMVDKNADGRISAEEVKEIITLSASANNLSKIKDHAAEYTDLIMEELAPDNHGYIELYNLETLLLQVPSQSTPLTNTHKLSQLLGQKLILSMEPNPIKRWYQKIAYFLDDNKKRVWVMALWLSICVVLFTWKFIQYRHCQVFEVAGYCLTTAKGAAETLKFNMALILLPMCRNTLTWLRSRTKLGVVVPFDDNINFHKVIAIGITIGVGLHAGAHLTCDFPKILHATDDQYEPIKQFFGEDRPPNYFWFLKGTEGWTGIVMVVLMAIAFTLAQPWFRRNKLKLPKPFNKLTGFNAFWYSHHLFIIVYVVFVIHGYFLYLAKEWYKKTTWMYLAIPVILYACERLVRAFRSTILTVNILKVAVYPGNVLALHMSKSHQFEYQSGQYIFIKCPAISPFQWHPFSITSAPGDDYLSIYIRTLGDWTSELKALFSKACEPESVDQNGVLIADMMQNDRVHRFPKLLVDGPYGAPAQDYMEYDVLLLVGLGIGATPLISIVKDVLNNIKQQKKSEEGVEDDNMTNKRKSFATSRAYFYWITREAGSFEWFKGVLNEVTENDQERIIELHNYCTSVYEEGDARSALITMLQYLHLAKNGVDIVSGTHVKTHFARPNWRDVYNRIAVNHINQRVGVFYCGVPGLTGELSQLAHEFSRQTSTSFEFHKENF